MFSKIDNGNKGYLSYDDVLKAISNVSGFLGSFSDEQFLEIDTNRDGKIDFDEFKNA